MLTDDDWLEKFIKDYKKKLAEEKQELFALTIKTEEQQEQNDISSFLFPTAVESSKITIPLKSEQFDQEVIIFPSLLSERARNADHNEAVERKKKQEEYRCILDQQLAEQKQRKEEELQRRRREETDDFEMTSNHSTDRRSFAIRSPSPPIKSHYRKSVQVRVSSRPLIAESDNRQRLSDLTELRQLYSNR